MNITKTYRDTMMAGITISYLIITVLSLLGLSGGSLTSATWMLDSLKVFIPGSEFDFGEAIGMAGVLVFYILILVGFLGSFFVLIIIFTVNEVIYSEPYNSNQEIIEARKVLKKCIIQNYIISSLFGLIIVIPFTSALG